MKIVNMDSHDFEKTNLVGDKHHRDHYECKVCGCKGVRITFTPEIKLTEAEYKKSLKCTYKANKPQARRPKQVALGKMPYIGIEEGIHDVVECPENYKKKYADDVWVFSKKRQEPVRILSDEIAHRIF